MPDPSLTGRMRPVDLYRDLDPIADLIEVCFANQMDDDGRDYLRHIRRAARTPSMQRWVDGANERVSVPLFGYVWEEGGRVIGNLTLIPFKRGAAWRYLIANVATHPNYRGRGIARLLTQTAIDHVRSRGVPEVWLQVRDDNPAAHHLYAELGFVERARRATWRQAARPPSLAGFDSLRVGPRLASDWPVEQEWLQAAYPPEVAWNLNFTLDRYAPGFWRELTRFLKDERIDQWCVRSGERLVGAVVWDAAAYNTDAVWLAPDPLREEDALRALLAVVRRRLVLRPLYLNYPAGHGAAAFQELGFELHNTLIWMAIQFTP